MTRSIGSGSIRTAGVRRRAATGEGPARGRNGCRPHRHPTHRRGLTTGLPGRRPWSEAGYLILVHPVQPSVLKAASVGAMVTICWPGLLLEAMTASGVPLVLLSLCQRQVNPSRPPSVRHTPGSISPSPTPIAYVPSSSIVRSAKFWLPQSYWPSGSSLRTMYTCVELNTRSAGWTAIFTTWWSAADQAQVTAPDLSLGVGHGGMPINGLPIGSWLLSVNLVASRLVGTVHDSPSSSAYGINDEPSGRARSGKTFEWHGVGHGVLPAGAAWVVATVGWEGGSVDWLGEELATALEV